MQVADAGEVELAVAAAELGDVRDPAQIRPLGGEVALQQVRRRHHGGVSAPPPLATPVSADQAVRAHQPGHAVATRSVAGPAELTSDPRCPVGAA